MKTAMILKLDKAGNPIRWLNHEQAIRLYVNDRVIAALGNENFMIRGGINAVSLTQSRIEVNSILLTRSPVRAVRQQASYVPTLSNKALFRRDRHTCLYCGTAFYDSELTRDHVVPTSRGGKDTWANVVTACKRCNNRKGDRLLQEMDMPLMAIPFVPNHAEWLILRNRKILADQMSFLVSRCSKAMRWTALPI